MKIIVAGFPKTGTKSMNAALTQLGYKVYDFPEHFWFAGTEWNKMMTFGGSPEKLKDIYDEIDAVCDLPTAYFWDELLKLFPDAKIILTKRDEDSWWKSMQNQLLAHNTNYILRLSYFLTWTGYCLCKFQANMGPLVFGNSSSTFDVFTTHYLDERRARMIYRRHNAWVEHTAPKENLLIYDVKDGWKPLCKFLGVEMPTTSFPHKNIRGDILEKMMREHPVFKRLIKELALSFIILSGLSAFLFYKFYHI